jgi:hypothetical protein
VLYLREGSKTRPFSYKESQGTFHVWKVLRLEEDAFVPCHDKLNWKALWQKEWRFIEKNRAFHTVALPFTQKSNLKQKKNYWNSNISPRKNIIFKKSSKRNLQDIIITIYN